MKPLQSLPELLGRIETKGQREIIHPFSVSKLNRTDAYDRAAVYDAAQLMKVKCENMINYPETREEIAAFAANRKGSAAVVPSMGR